MKKSPVRKFAILSVSDEGDDVYALEVEKGGLSAMGRSLVVWMLSRGRNSGGFDEARLACARSFADDSQILR